MPRRKTDPTLGLAAARDYLTGNRDSAVVATAVRFLLEELQERIPGNSVEVRVPPFMAVQCVGGPQHRRGTPPNVVEMDAETWLGLALGTLQIDDAEIKHLVRASGTRALEFAAVLPLIRA